MGFIMVRSELEGIEAFLRVAERRNFSAAAADLGISASALSQKIRSLEMRAGVALLTRTTRRVGLTEAGQLLLSRAGPAIAELRSAYLDARTLSQPVGLLRLHVPRGVLQTFIEPMLAGFCSDNPQVEVEVFAEDHMTDLIESGFDAGIRQGELLDADMTILQIMPPFRLIVVGAPEYFERNGRPARPVDLRHHNCIRTRLRRDTIMNWNFVEDGRSLEVFPTGQIILNDYALSVSSALAGLGLAYVSEPSVQEYLTAGTLEAVLTRHALTSSGVFLYYPHKNQVTSKLRAFIDHVQRSAHGSRRAR